ncbi:MAG: efflux RND transporter periplasmic adaptor subunit [Rhodospirillales bacterium]|nr:efflux RND transporter periplasmic adaptor subunit [Rhodospirillales bacterium]
MRISGKAVVSALVVAAVVTAVGLAWRSSTPSVAVGAPQRGPAVEAVYGTGVVEPVVWAKVASLVRGRIVSHCACEGRAVKAGDVLARLDEKEQAARVRELEARQVFLRREQERYKQLVQSQTTSIKEYERTVSELAQNHEAIAAARERLIDYTVRAPIDGVVLRRDGEIGEIAEVGQALFWVGQPAPLWITAEVDEEDIPRVKEGQRTLIKADAFPGRELQGRVERITPKGDPILKSYRVRVALPAETPLMIGMTTEINVVVREVKEALLLPIDAIHGGFAFVLDNGRARAVKVTTGIRGQAFIQVTGGLTPDARVILDAPPTLKDGERVRVRANSAAAKP